MWRPVIVASGVMALLVNAAWIGRITMRHRPQEPQAFRIIACQSMSPTVVIQPRVLVTTRVIPTRVPSFSPMPVYTPLGRILAPMPVVVLAGEEPPLRVLVSPKGAPEAGAVARGSLIVVRPALESRREVSVRFRDIVIATRAVTVPNTETRCETIGRSRRFMPLIPRALR